ncbi:short neuropeptide F-like [Argiope bruennichi]|uniref:short neuropeptide F-like n=1 Tax=Argiope bruennichi TaxID=94029 RepID=UPI0024953EA0|nr:short neuropeptide F-like [Argiope bruennichi]
MSSGNAVRVCSVLLVVVLLTAELVSAAPYNDYDKGALQQTYYDVHPYPGSVFFPDLRDLYELLIRNEAAAAAPASAYNHQMERKGGRSPSLRLRFGRRADPLWHAENPSDSTSN